MKIIPHAGWSRNLLLSNDHAELIVTLDVGPRILSYKNPGAENIFKTFEGDLGTSGEGGFVLRGGHRLWIAPEDEVLSYHADNHPVEFRDGEFPGEIVIDSLHGRGGNIMKSLGITLAGGDSCATLRHTVRNDGPEPVRIAAWALSVMRPGGIAVIPQPPFGEHPRDLLPNRGLVLWPYTDLSDPRFHFGKHFFSVRQCGGFPPAKIGLAHREKWVAYVSGDSVFIKTFDHVTGAVYPDGGCNFEVFTNGDMIEIESLSPLASLAPGESVSHAECWHLFPITGEVTIESEEDLAGWLQPFLAKAGL